MNIAKKDLPAEIWIHILLFLDATSLREISSVSRKWFTISNDQKTWERICVENGILGTVLIEDIGSEG